MQGGELKVGLLLDPRMLQGLLAGDALGGVVGQQLLDEIFAVGRPLVPDAF